jgi:hypothetical protein
MRHIATFALLFSAVFAHAQTSVKVDEQGVDVEVPGVDVDIDESGVDVTVPGVDVDINENGVSVDVAGVDVDVSGVETNVVDGRGETRADAPAPANMRNISVSVGVKNYACEAGEGVSINSTSSMYTITGPCDTIRVSGTGNVINIDQVRRIELDGTGNALTWNRSLTNKLPITQVSGTGNVVNRK